MASPKKPKVRPGKWPPLLAFISDPHVGNHARKGGPLVDGLNRRGHETVDALRRAVLLAKEQRVQALVVCGDLFHVPRPEPALTRAVQDVFRETDTMQVVLVPGNHDMPDATAEKGNTAMAPLYRRDLEMGVENVQVVTKPGWVHFMGVSVLAIPYDGTMAMSDRVALAMESAAREEVARDKWGAPGVKHPSAGEEPNLRVAAIHVGLWDADDAAPWMRKARDGMEAESLLNLMRQARVRASFVGNYHSHRQWGGSGGLDGNPTAVQVGTLCPHRHGDGTGHGLVAFLEADGTVVTKEVPGPRFMTFTRKEDVPMQYAPDGFSWYVRLRGEAARGFRGSAYDGDEAGSWADLEIEPATPSADAVLDAAEGRRAPRVDTDEGAIRGYVAGMVMPDGVSREAVEALALDCWKRA